MIVGVAIKHEGTVYSLPKPKRHPHVLAENGEERLPSGIIKWRLASGTQGFVTDTGEFLNRRQAATHALNCGQIERLKFSSRELFSEDLW